MNLSGRDLLLLTLMVALFAVSGCGGGGGGASPATVQGAVIDAATADPVGGATVSISSDSDTTGADGSFSFATLSGTRTLSVNATGYQQRQINLSLTPGNNDLGEILLEQSLQQDKGTVKGRVLDSSGAPVAEALVRYGNMQAISRDDGSFTIFNVLAGTQVITAISGGAVGWATAEVVAGETTSGVTISLGIRPPPPPGFL